jgi:glutathione S-transferase
MGVARSEEHLRRHPFGRVPVIEDGDFRLYETQAILRYLDALFPEPGLQPADIRAAARMNQIAGIVDWYFFPKVSACIVWERLLGPRLLGRAADEARIAKALPHAEVCVRELDRLLGRGAFLAGDALTIADLMLAPQFEYFLATPEGQMLSEGTALPAWLARMQARGSMQRTRVEAVTRSAA